MTAALCPTPSRPRRSTRRHVAVVKDEAGQDVTLVGRRAQAVHWRKRGYSLLQIARVFDSSKIFVHTLLKRAANRGEMPREWCRRAPVPLPEELKEEAKAEPEEEEDDGFQAFLRFEREKAEKAGGFFGAEAFNWCVTEWTRRRRARQMHIDRYFAGPGPNLDGGRKRKSPPKRTDKTDKAFFRSIPAKLGDHAATRDELTAFDLRPCDLGMKLEQREEMLERLRGTSAPPPPAIEDPLDRGRRIAGLGVRKLWGSITRTVAETMKRGLSLRPLATHLGLYVADLGFIALPT